MTLHVVSECFSTAVRGEFLTYNQSPLDSTWIPTAWGDCRLERSNYGVGVKTGANFRCRAGALVLSYGPCRVVSPEEYLTSGWQGYGFEVAGGILIPVGTRATNRYSAFLVNAVSRERGEVPNTRLIATDTPYPTVILRSTKAIGPHTTLLTTYGADFGRQLRQQRDATAAARVGVARSRTVLCTVCGEFQTRRRFLQHRAQCQ